MLKKLTKTGNSLALVLDKPLLDRAQIDADTPLEVSFDAGLTLWSPDNQVKKGQLRICHSMSFHCGWRCLTQGVPAL